MDEERIRRLKVVRLVSGIIGAGFVFSSAILSVGQLLGYFDLSNFARLPLSMLIVGLLICLLTMITNTKIRFAEEELAE